MSEKQVDYKETFISDCTTALESTTFEVELSEVKRHDGEGSLYYCVIRRDGEHLHTRQTLNPDRARLLALQLLSKEFVEWEVNNE